MFVFKWNRSYPCDFYFDIPLENWKLSETFNFVGNSQEITIDTEKETEPIQQNQEVSKSQSLSFDFSSVPAYCGKLYFAINNNIHFFTEADYTTEDFEYYSPLDLLGRCGVAYACVGTDMMPTTDRGNVGSVKPTGWHTIKYECVSGLYLYNRCHLIGYQLTGENANERKQQGLLELYP